jgi:large subunit ribosomal protein L17
MMRHQKRGRKLKRDKSHREALLRNLVREVFQKERVITTEAKAKEARKLVEKVITLAKRNDLSARRQAFSLLQDREMVKKVFSEIPERFAEREGGYTRILKLKNRQGDTAPLVILELV